MASCALSPAITLQPRQQGSVSFHPVRRQCCFAQQLRSTARRRLHVRAAETGSGGSSGDRESSDSYTPFPFSEEEYVRVGLQLVQGNPMVRLVSWMGAAFLRHIGHRLRPPACPQCWLSKRCSSDRETLLGGIAMHMSP